MGKDLQNILFFLSHQPNPRFIKQINYLADHNNRVSVIYFNRSTLPDLSANINRSVTYLSAGEIASSGRYLSRVAAYLKAMRILWRYKMKANSDVIIVNNIDVLILEKLMQLLSFRAAKTVLEISDLLQYTFGRDILAKLFKTIDKIIVRLFVDRLIVTSKEFYNVHYSKFFHKPYLVLENKPLKRNVPSRIEHINGAGPIIIGVVGLLYQAAPLRALFDSVKNNLGVEVHIHGRLYETQDTKALIESYCAANPNIIFKGEYDFFRDAASIYSGLDLLYISYDTSDGHQNNKVALPNKLYEAMYFQVPMIVSKGTYLAERVREAGIGYEVDCGDVEKIRDIIKLHPTKTEDFKIAFRNLPEESYLADEDYRAFYQFVTI